MTSKLILAAGICCLPLISCTTNKEDSTEQTQAKEGHDLVMKSIEAHGGTEKWYNNGQLQFRWTYHMSDKEPEKVLDSIQTIDPKSLAIVHEVPDSNIRFGMKDGRSWILPAEAKFGSPVAFWSLTPYYFIGIPFVFNDPNASFEKLPDMMAFEAKDYTQVKITFNEKAGDSPDDYYVLLIDPKTNLTKGAYYTVTNKLVAPDGPGPAKFISLDNLKDVDGILMASGHRTFEMVDGKIADQMRYTDVSEVKYLPADTVDLSIPEGAEMQ